MHGSLEEHLRVLGCDAHSTLDEIKTAHRKLSILHHPDTTGSSDSTMFRAVQASYEFLKRNHKPKPKPRDMSGYLKLYRIFSRNDSELATTMPMKTIEENTVLVCMWGMTEFNVFLENGTELPITIEIKNIRSWPVRMTISYEDEI